MPAGGRPDRHAAALRPLALPLARPRDPRPHRPRQGALHAARLRAHPDARVVLRRAKGERPFVSSAVDATRHGRPAGDPSLIRPDDGAGHGGARAAVAGEGGHADGGDGGHPGGGDAGHTGGGAHDGH